MLDTVLNTLSPFSEQPFEAGNCCEGEETEFRTNDLESQDTEPGHMLLAALSFFQPLLPVLQLGISSSFSHWQVC